MGDFDPAHVKIKRHVRAKRMQIKISRVGEVFLVLPRWVPLILGRAFVQQKKEWIISHLADIKPMKKVEKITKDDREKARIYLTERTEYWSKKLGVVFNDIRIKDTRTRWGSCSGKGNLNYSARIMKAPKEVIDYLVIHEVCHLKEMNHGPKFWALVESLDPDYKAHSLWLKHKGAQLH